MKIDSGTDGPSLETGVSERQLEVIEVVRHAPDLTEILLALGDVTFEPGDCLSLYAEDNRTSRPYSIASGVDEPVLRFLIKRVEGGEVTSFLASRRPGDMVLASLPYGWFRPGQNNGESPFVFVATGTGIAPFLSYVKSFPSRPPVQCLYGVRTQTEAVGHAAFNNICPCPLALSREEVGGHFHGRVTDLLPCLKLTPETHVYLCGLDAMIDEVSDWLEANGINPFNIHREVFFHASSE